MTTEPITLRYSIDLGAALAAGHAIAGGAYGHTLELTDALLASLPQEDRTWLASLVSGLGVIDVATRPQNLGPNADYYPLHPGRLDAATLAGHVAACRAVWEASAARLADERAARQAQDAAHAAALAREQAVLTQALAAPEACVLAFLPARELWGNASADYVAERGIHAWLASASADLAAYWERHRSTDLPAVRQARARVQAHVEGLRAERAAARKQWVDDMVTFWGTHNDRERRAAGVLPRADIDALVWAAIQAPNVYDDRECCPNCGEENIECDWEAGKPVSAAVWAAAQAIAGALQADVLETLGLAVTRDIVLVTYDCRSCEPSHRFELKLTLEHPENGWSTYRPRYYPLEEV